MSDTIKQLRRIIYLLSLLKDDFEWLAMDAIPEKKKKITNVWREKISWVLRDIVTSTQKQESFNQVFTELNSDRAKTLLEWIDLGILCKNIDEVIATIKGASTPLVEAPEKISRDNMPPKVGVKAFDMMFPDAVVKDDDGWKWLMMCNGIKLEKLPYHVVDYLRSENIDIKNKHEKA